MSRHSLCSSAAVKAALLTRPILKGAPLAFSIYPNPGMRPMDDIDILVPLGRAREALSLLHAASGEFTENPPAPELCEERAAFNP